MPGEPAEMPVQPERPDIKQPSDPSEPQIPEEAPDNQPPEILPPGQTEKPDPGTDEFEK